MNFFTQQKKILAFLLFFTSIAFSQTSSEKKFSLELLPSEHIAPLFTANATEHRITISKIFEVNNYTGGMGGSFPLASAAYEGITGQLAIASTGYVYLRRTPGHLQVETIDFFVDVYADIVLGKEWTVRSGFGHTSQHFVDDAFEILEYKKSINYVRDYFKFFILKKAEIFNGFLYAGAYYNYHFVINTPTKNKMIYEFGSEVLNTHLTDAIILYLACDIKIHGELNNGTTQNYQIGLKMGEEFGHMLRLAYNYRAGLEERGQFYNQRVHCNILGLYFDF
jgi:hypothetical protein